MRRYTVEALALAIALAAQLEIWAEPVPGPRVAAAVAALLGTLPLLLRRRFPFAAPAAVFMALAGVAVVEPAAVRRGSAFMFFALLLAFWAAGAQRERRHAAACTALGLAALAVIAQSAGAATEVETGSLGLGLVTFALLGAGLATAAFALQARSEQAAELQRRAERLEREREARAHAAVVAERARIARDLHDVIAHSVSVMTLQTGAARLLLDHDPRRAREPLLVVEDTGRQALAEMRRLLGVVHGDLDAAAPRLGDLTALAERMRQAGLPVQLTVNGDPRPLAPGLELTAYRVVQEALTNTLKHAGPARARVTIHYETDALGLEVTDDGHAHGGAPRGGHGLIGMRERVALYGGDVDARPGPVGFTVAARIPLEAGAR